MAPAEIEVYSSFWSLLKPVLVHHVYWEQTIASISFDENPLSRKKHYHEYTNKRKLSIGTSQRIPQNLTFIFSPCLSFSRGHCVRNHTPESGKGQIADGWRRKHNERQISRPWAWSKSKWPLAQRSAHHSREPRPETHASSDHASTFDGEKATNNQTYSIVSITESLFSRSGDPGSRFVASAVWIDACLLRSSEDLLIFNCTVTHWAFTDHSKNILLNVWQMTCF